MSTGTLLDKVWAAHEVAKLADGASQLFIARHLLHEVTSPQAFGMLRTLKLPVAYPQRTFATVDHIVPTCDTREPFADPLANEMIGAIRTNCAETGIEFFDLPTGKQGVIHIVMPEQGIIHPGMTVACGDSHTATHGAFGAVAFGIGTSQVRDVLATQTMAITKPKVRRINVNGRLGAGVTAKDVILHIIRKLGVNGGLGYAYEFGGSTFDNFTMEERMTVCNMAIEGGARVGYVNPDEKTFAYLRDLPYAPATFDSSDSPEFPDSPEEAGASLPFESGVKPPHSQTSEWNAAVARWKSFASDADAVYDDTVDFDAAEIAPTVTWGINPAQAVFINETIPSPTQAGSVGDAERAAIEEALAYMKLPAGAPIKGTKVDVVFIGSCTNGRLSDLIAAAQCLKGHKVKKGVWALAVPGSQVVDQAARKLGLDEIFRSAGFEWRAAGCSMCLAMNPDKLVGDQLCASTSNRNFKGRQGSPTGRTILVSPVMAAAAAVTGEISDAREVFEILGN